MMFAPRLPIFALMAAASFAAEPFTHAQTGIALPEKVAGISRGKAEKYGSPGGQIGLAIPYRTEAVEITVFIRPVDPKQSLTAAAVVEESTAAVVEGLEVAKDAEIKVLKVSDDAAAPGWAKGGFVASAGPASFYSYTYATIKAGHVIKLRITTPNAQYDSIPKFVAEIQKVVNDAKPKR